MRRTALLLCVLVASFGVVAAGCGGEEQQSATPETVEGEVTPPETETTETTDTGASGCVGCHTLADAGATGTVGPNLDEAQPSEELVVDRVTNGQGAMPPFSGSLTEQQIADVAAYVSSVAGQ